MKSIKEKAEEHGLEYPGIRCSNDDIYKDCDKPSMDFEVGANYVVEQIESACMNGVYAKDKYRNVLNVLEQLKK